MRVIKTSYNLTLLLWREPHRYHLKVIRMHFNVFNKELQQLVVICTNNNRVSSDVMSLSIEEVEAKV